MKPSLPCRNVEAFSAAARKRMLEEGTGLLRSDWRRAVFLHFETDPRRLQRQVPFEIDLHDGRAYVSIVAFHLERMRLRTGGPILEWLMKPVARHELLNVRTYVRDRGVPGIFFLSEFLPNRLSLGLGPHLCGLPYRCARLRYSHSPVQNAVSGCACGRDGRLSYRARLSSSGFVPCIPASLDAFLLERYTAFTWRNGVERFFRVWHPPWEQVALTEVEIQEETLLRSTGEWFGSARLIGGHYAPGFEDVWMGWPIRIPPGGLKNRGETE